MISSFVQGVVGLLIVMSVFIGGTMAAGICYETFTPNVKEFYIVWLWMWLVPFWWLCCRSLAYDQIKHPAATYVGFLPFLLLMSMLIDKLGPGNWWNLPVMLAGFLAYSLIWVVVRRGATGFASANY